MDYISTFNPPPKFSSLCNCIACRNIETAEVIACSLNVALNLKAVSKFTIIPSQIFIDEATQSPEFKLLNLVKPMTQNLVLAGDHKQLGPIFKCNQLKSFGHTSLFERMINDAHEFVMLNTQYRMHPSIAKNSAHLFYLDRIQSGVSAAQRNAYLDMVGTIFPKQDPRLFVDVLKGKETLDVNRSYSNRKEAEVIIALLNYFTNFRWKNNAKPTIAVISNYLSQTNLIRSLNRERHKDWNGKIFIETVDSFQGQEVDFVFISAVRANSSNEIGFLKESRRMNVSITRARHGLIIVGKS